MCFRAASGMFATSVVRTRDKNPENTTREHFEMYIGTEAEKKEIVLRETKNLVIATKVKICDNCC